MQNCKRNSNYYIYLAVTLKPVYTQQIYIVSESLTEVYNMVLCDLKVSHRLLTIDYDQESCKK